MLLDSLKIIKVSYTIRKIACYSLKRKIFKLNHIYCSSIVTHRFWLLLFVLNNYIRFSKQLNLSLTFD